MDYVFDDAPDFQLHIATDGAGGVFLVLGDQGDGAVLEADAFDGEFAVDVGDDDVFVGRLGGAIHDQEIAGVDAGIDHGIAGDADKISRGRMGDEIFVEIELGFEVVLGGRGKTGGDGGGIKRAGTFTGSIGRIYFFNLGFFHGKHFLSLTNKLYHLSQSGTTPLPINRQTGFFLWRFQDQLVRGIGGCCFGGC